MSVYPFHPSPDDETVHLERHDEAACGASRRSNIDRAITDEMEWVDCDLCKKTLPYKQWLASRNPEPRTPSGNHVVYPLGHHEQMLIQRALRYHDDAVVRSLATIFRSHGTVTIIRQDDEQ